MEENSEFNLKENQKTSNNLSNSNKIRKRSKKKYKNLLNKASLLINNKINQKLIIIKTIINKLKKKEILVLISLDYLHNIV